MVHTSRVCFGRVKYIQGGYCGPRRQRDYELVILHSGSAEVTVDNEQFALPLDYAILFLPGRREHFRFDTEQESEHLWCSVSPAFMPAKLRRQLKQAPRMVPCSELMSRLFSAVQGRRRPASEGEQAVIDHLGLALFAEYLHQAEHAQPKGRRDEALSRALAYVEDHYADEDCLQGARRAAQCSVSALGVRFRKFLGMSPAHHLWLTRVERGVQMLRETGLTVAEISSRCGCKNPFHFSRLVRRSQGLSPREIRRAAWR